MVDPENGQSVRAAIIVGCCMIVGLTAAGYFIGKGMARFKSEVRTVTVKWIFRSIRPVISFHCGPLFR